MRLRRALNTERLRQHHQTIPASSAHEARALFRVIGSYTADHAWRATAARSNRSTGRRRLFRRMSPPRALADRSRREQAFPKLAPVCEMPIVIRTSRLKQPGRRRPLRPDIGSASRALRNGPQLVLDRLPRRWRGDTSDEQPQREGNLKQGHWYPHERGDRTAEESCEL